MSQMGSPRSLNFPTGCAFRGHKQNFEFYMLESGHDSPGPGNDPSRFGSGDFDPMNPCAPNILVSATGSTSRMLRQTVKWLAGIARRIAHLRTSCLSLNVFDSGEIETGGIRVRSPRSRLE
jgi:hypothetical protein